jgi:hypothetical protein
VDEESFLFSGRVITLPSGQRMLTDVPNQDVLHSTSPRFLAALCLCFSHEHWNSSAPVCSFRLTPLPTLQSPSVFGSTWTSVKRWSSTHVASHY